MSNGTAALAEALEAQRERLLPCVHCGFCLPVCPTYTRLGDENDSPRGRLHLMRAVVEGRLDASSQAFHTHIDRCLGCRACEPVCPSGVEYGTLLELARESINEERKPALLTRIMLAVFATPTLRGAFMAKGRVLRWSGVAAFFARIVPAVGPLRAARLGSAMLASTSPWERLEAWVRDPVAETGPAPEPERRGRVGVLMGCVQQGLFARVNAATVRVLEANGFEVVPVAGQDCCGALHAHGGDLERARALAAANIEAFEAVGVDWIAVNAAGCGAAMKEYGTLFELEPAWRERAALFAAKVRDATELLADAGPRPGAELQCTVAYDHPCHLLHAQRVERAPLAVLEAVPGVEIRVVGGAEECCGGAGIYGITHPELGGRIGRDKVDAVRACGADAIATPNPGCMMQIGAGLRLEGAREGVIHPVELLDASYHRAGYYEGRGAT